MELVVHRTCVLSNQKRKENGWSTGIQENIRKDQLRLATRLHDRTCGCIEWIDRSSKREKRIPVILRRDKTKVKASAGRV